MSLQTWAMSFGPFACGLVPSPLTIIRSYPAAWCQPGTTG
jgi:hypothetical protein